MDTVLFIPYFIESHILPTLGMMQALQSKYTVLYALPAKFKWFADLHQLHYINLESVPFGYGFEKVIRKSEGSKSIYRQSLYDRRHSRIALHREKKLMEIVTAAKPRLVILDLLSSTDFILLYKWLAENKAGVAIHNPMLSTYQHPGVPHLGSSRLPVDRFRIGLENRAIQFMNNLFQLKENIVYTGNSNRSIIKKESAKRKIPQAYQLAPGNYFANFFSNIPEIISAPEELEFYMGKSSSNQHYTGTLPVQQRSDASDTPEFRNLLNEIELWRMNRQNKVIFCAFGSMNSQSNPAVRHFLQKLFEVSIDTIPFKLICAFNDKNRGNNYENLPGHVKILHRVPQLEMLKCADVFITHAGLGSIKESIHAGVPMLAYPYTKDWDSNGNAVKIAWHGLGLNGDIKKDSNADIQHKIVTLLSDSKYKESVHQFKSAVESKYTTGNFLATVEKLMADPIE